jgi:hypothetical protein
MGVIGPQVRYGQRYYDPTQVRWTQQDPLNQFKDLVQSNRYGYVGENPINYFDRTDGASGRRWARWPASSGQAPCARARRGPSSVPQAAEPRWSGRRRTSSRATTTEQDPAARIRGASDPIKDERTLVPARWRTPVRIVAVIALVIATTVAIIGGKPLIAILFLAMHGPPRRVLSLALI